MGPRSLVSGLRVFGAFVEVNGSYFNTNGFYINTVILFKEGIPFAIFQYRPALLTTNDIVYYLNFYSIIDNIVQGFATVTSFL